MEPIDTKELAAALADDLGCKDPVTVTCHKPTEYEIFLHRLKTGQLYFGARPQGIEPSNYRRWLRRQQ